MSPTAFKQHVTQLLSDLQRCTELCTIILQNRRVGNKHESLDRLQTGLIAASKSITIEFNALRAVFGSRFDTGDDICRHAVKGAIRSVELDVEGKLEDIASKRNDGLPGFRDMLRKIQMMEQNVLDNFESFAQRLERPAPQPTTKVPESKPKPKQPEPKKPKSDEVVMQLKEFEKYIDHMKNSWTETLVAGKILYVNAWDEKKLNTWERPSSGFIKTLPKPAPRPVYEQPQTQPRRRPTSDYYSQPGGW